ncbi:MAG: ShlB/FhaC/HecB family hemolysin secretion/activation protein [Aphanizomenon gracile PMC627.10]|nr:ShlB/FhaC/HecB family hemolysin secretion/activation protein [Aphanizomenon gracile PMC627.10]
MANAQTIDLAQVPNNNSNSPVLPNQLPIPQDTINRTPSPSQIFQPSKPQIETPPNIQLPSEVPEIKFQGCPDKITVEKFEIIAEHPVFPITTLESAVNNDEFLNRPLSCTEMFRAALVITEIYHKSKYQTSGAKVIIPQEVQTNQNQKRIVLIKVIEGELEEIRVKPFCRNRQNSGGDNNPTDNCSGKTKPLYLNPEYVRSRLNLVKSKPLNIARLQEALQLLRLNSPIKNISANLYAGSKPGNTILEVQIEEGETLNMPLSMNNSRSPSSGSFQRSAGISNKNLLGMGDSISWNYNHTDGSSGWDISYSVPFNSRNGTLAFSYNNTSTQVIEPPFNNLDINSKSRSYELTIRQPVIQAIKQTNGQENYDEFSLGLTFSRKESDTSLLGTPYPLSPGANDQGSTRISTVRFFQEWSRQNSRQVLAVRSQFNLGIGVFNTTINQPIPGVNEVIPDNRFFSSSGQGQWVQLLAPETILLLRTNMQFAGRTLVPLEQFAIGGFGSVRGYRQDTLLNDNGIFTSAELQFPVLRIPRWKTIFQLTPFVDYGTASNTSEKQNSNPNSLASVGLGLKLQQGDNFTARLDWGIPLIYVNSRERTWQENGLTFTLSWNPF